MKYCRIFFLLTIPILLAGFLTSCVLPGTGTLHIRNELTGGQDITAIYLFTAESTYKGSSIISNPLMPNNTIAEYGIVPGDYLIEAELDDGQTAIISTEVVENQINIIWIRDSDIQ